MSIERESTSAIIRNLIDFSCGVLMRFEARELETAAAPIEAKALVIDRVYFSVQFVDTALLIPVVEPLVFIGRDFMPNDTGVLYFQDADSHNQGIRFGSDDKDQAAVYAQSEKSISHIFEFERALDLLLVCSLRRQKLEAKLSQ